tara:strand:+ start:262 stop:957 length:696 start_codon:yes stop_codon:yes gene_type:complete
MVENSRIAQHDGTVDAAIAALTATVIAYWTAVELNLSRVFSGTPTVSSARTQLTQQLGSLGDLITPVLNDQLSMLGYSNSGYTPTRNQLRDSAVELITQTNSGAFETLMAAVALSIISGGEAVAARLSLETLAKSLSGGVTRSIQDTVVATDSAYGIYIMRDRGVERFTYAGGVIDTTREFCESHVDKTYSEAEIRSIWSSQTWGGKKPGDPFVTRGGYNCRHHWIPDAQQ